MAHKKTGTPKKKKMVKRRKKPATFARAGSSSIASPILRMGQSGLSSGMPEMPEMFDRRAMEKIHADLGRLMAEQDFENADEANVFVQQFIGAKDIPKPQRELTPLERAQDKMYEAFGAKGERRVELAREALTISPDCADAYVLLAEETAESNEEARELYEQGVRAGERALSKEFFEENAGHFWGILETRPYMRARAGLAATLEAMGEQKQAVEHYRELLRLNPTDNQGNRDALARCLLTLGENEELGGLLDQFKEDASANWLYTRALWLFRKEGSSAAANAALKKAMNQNRFVPAYLLGLEEMPDELPAYIGVGDANEAIEYAGLNAKAWLNTEGALPWFMDIAIKTWGHMLSKRSR